MSSIRVEVMPLNGGYVAVFRSVAAPDEILDGADGRPRVFTTAGEAREQGYLMLDARNQNSAPAVRPDPLGIAEWRYLRDREAGEERRRVFADAESTITRGDRTIVVERRRR